MKKSVSGLSRRNDLAPFPKLELEQLGNFDDP